MTRFVPGYAFETSPVGQKRTRVLSSENKKDTPPPSCYAEKEETLANNNWN